MKSIGLYIHIPFCVKKCGYCDFTSYRGNEYQIDEYLDYLEKELNLYSEGNLIEGVQTIFIGGGTPSILSPIQLERLFSIVRAKLDMSN